ncbi:MAG: hypothetical protein JXQ90_10480 [Cyclobacteriaceae bacterium]
MNITIKKILIWTVSIIGIGVIGYFGFIGYGIYLFLSGCGLDDGPFEAVLIDEIELTEEGLQFDLSDNGALIIENRSDTLSPVITLIENGKVKWTLDADTRHTKGYESTRLWEVSNLTITQDTDPIEMSFTGHWTYGGEEGAMEIDRDDGENSFCLSW